MSLPKVILIAFLVHGVAGILPAAPPAPVRLTPKDFRVLPFCGSMTNRKLDPKDKGTFDELKVTTSERIRIHGKKKHETGKVGQASYFHLGKLALAPPGDRTGKVEVRQPPSQDAVQYFMVLELGEKLSSKYVYLQKGSSYEWALKTAGTTTTFSVMEGAKVVASVSAEANRVSGFGFAATARWPGNEVDLVATFD